MKKITFILLALISGTAFAQNTQTAWASVNAEIVMPITISSEGSLDFGLITPIGTVGQVKLTPGNVRTMSAGMEVPSNTATDVPLFTVTKENGLSYTIVTDSDNLTLAGATPIIIKEITTNLGDGGVYSADSFKVGGTLEIAGNQEPGQYEGKVYVTVSYQ